MNLLLIDDHPLFGVGFALAVSHARPDVQVQIASGIEQGLAMVDAGPAIDMVLLDYRLGRDDGLEGLRRFGARHPLVARVLISGDEDAALAARARAVGASAFLGKSLAIAEMLAVLQKVWEGGEHFGMHVECAAQGGAAGAGPTARQLEVLTLVGRGRQNKQIADELGIAERTVKLHITALFDTLKARNRTHLLVRARELGLS